MFNIFGKKKKEIRKDRTLYVFTSTDESDYISKCEMNIELVHFYKDFIYKRDYTTDDIFTTCIAGLRGAQNLFSEIYVDNHKIWPEHDGFWVGEKELRIGHDLSRIVSARINENIHYKYGKTVYEKNLVKEFE